MDGLNSHIKDWVVMTTVKTTAPSASAISASDCPRHRGATVLTILHTAMK